MRADRTGRPTQQVASSGQSQTVRPVLRIRRPCPPRARCTGQSGIVAATDGEPGWPPVCHQTGAAARRDDLIRKRPRVSLAWFGISCGRPGSVGQRPKLCTEWPEMGETLGFNADSCRPLAEVGRSTETRRDGRDPRRTAHNPATYGSVGGSAESCRPPRCSIVSAITAASRPSRTRSLRES
jgi:hypothetical protein